MVLIRAVRENIGVSRSFIRIAMNCNMVRGSTVGLIDNAHISR